MEWVLVKLPEHENRQLVAYSRAGLDRLMILPAHRLDDRCYIEREQVYSTWLEVATSKLVYAATIAEHIALGRERELLGTHKLIGLGKYALRHFSYYVAGGST